MRQVRQSYLIRVQYLGFRYSGWQVQPGQRTIESMITKTLKFIHQDQHFKILGAGRTDAKVSALDMAFELFVKNTIVDTKAYLILLNKNLPPDIRALSINPAPEEFNIIKNAKKKEYVYLFSHGEKNHPFCAPFLANIHEKLDIDAMKKAAESYEGLHDFSAYTVKENRKVPTQRTITTCKLKENTVLTANFFPKKSYALHVEGAGFIRYQIRMIVGALVQLGRGKLSLPDIETSLQENNTIQLTYIAPGSGLLLHQLEFE